jgi:hypothetical protein
MVLRNPPKSEKDANGTLSEKIPCWNGYYSIPFGEFNGF